MNAGGKGKYRREDALELVKKVDTIWISKGRKQTSFDLTQDNPSEDTLMEHLLGRTGNMRAPTLLFGKLLVVGYNADLYTEIFQPLL